MMLKQKVKDMIITLLPMRVKQAILYDFRHGTGKISFSQEGEDMIIDRIFSGRKNGYYIDIGAHHPTRFSNTYHFYNRRGWNGINIDAMPGTSKVFNQYRPDDLNLELGIAKTEGEIVYYMFKEPLLNTFSTTEASKKSHDFKIIGTRKIRVYPLSLILDKFLPPQKKIDFMNIDVEGLDFEVIQSNNWTKYRPKVILIEDLNRWSIEEMPKKSHIFNFMTGVGYKLVSKTFNTLIFQDKSE